MSFFGFGKLECQSIFDNLWMDARADFGLDPELSFGPAGEGVVSGLAAVRGRGLDELEILC